MTRLVPHLEVLVAGASRRIGDLWSSVQMPRIRRVAAVTSCNQAVARFNTAFAPVITPLVTKATQLLQKFPGPALILGASFQPVQYDAPNRRLLNQELILSVQSGGTQILNHHNFLNEARLSAIGLVVYLAGLLNQRTDGDDRTKTVGSGRRTRRIGYGKPAARAEDSRRRLC